MENPPCEGVIGCHDCLNFLKIMSQSLEDFLIDPTPENARKAKFLAESFVRKE